MPVCGVMTDAELRYVCPFVMHDHRTDHVHTSRVVIYTSRLFQRLITTRSLSLKTRPDGYDGPTVFIKKKATDFPVEEPPNLATLATLT